MQKWLFYVSFLFLILIQGKIFCQIKDFELSNRSYWKSMNSLQKHEYITALRKTIKESNFQDYPKHATDVLNLTKIIIPDSLNVHTLLTDVDEFYEIKSRQPIPILFAIMYKVKELRGEKPAELKKLLELLEKKYK